MVEALLLPCNPSTNLLGNKSNHEAPSCGGGEQIVRRQKHPLLPGGCQGDHKTSLKSLSSMPCMHPTCNAHTLPHHTVLPLCSCSGSQCIPTVQISCIEMAEALLLTLAWLLPGVALMSDMMDLSRSQALVQQLLHLQSQFSSLCQRAPCTAETNDMAVTVCASPGGICGHHAACSSGQGLFCSSIQHMHQGIVGSYSKHNICNS